jgi:hypothetical protein
VVHCAYHLDPVADRFVEGHVAGAQSLATLGLRCNPDGLLGVLGYLLEGTGVWVLAVVTPVAEDYDRRAMVYGRQVLVPEPLRRQPEVAVHLDVDYAVAED